MGAELSEDNVFEATRRQDGGIDLRPQRLIPEAQAWFWSDRWRQLEREADADYAAGRYKSFASPADFLAELERIAAERDPDQASRASRGNHR